MSKRVLVVGGAGQLGRSVIKMFSGDYITINLDLMSNEQSSHNIIIDQNWQQESEISRIQEQIRNLTETKIEAIICSAGGWSGGNICNIEIFDQIQHMFKINTMSAVLSSYIANHYLMDGGLLVLTGAALPFKEPTPDMLAYALSKTSTHSLAVNLAQSGQLSKDSTLVTILPEVIDTPMNREAMPNADHSQWVSPDSMAGLLKMWADGNNRPKNGSFAIIKNDKGMAIPEFV